MSFAQKSLLRRIRYSSPAPAAIAAGLISSWPSLLSAVEMCRTGLARASCQRSIESGKSDPQVRKDWISAGCLCTAELKWPKSAGSPVSLVPKKTFLPCGTSVRAPAGATASRQSAPASRQATAAARIAPARPAFSRTANTRARHGAKLSRPLTGDASAAWQTAWRTTTRGRSKVALDQSKVGQHGAQQMEAIEADYGEESEIGDICTIVEIRGPHGSHVRMRSTASSPHSTLGPLKLPPQVALANFGRDDV